MWNRYDLKFRLVLAPGAPLTAFPPRIRVSSPGGVYNVEFYSPGPQKQMLIGEARDYRRLRGITRRGDVIRVGASTTIVLQYV